MAGPSVYWRNTPYENPHGVPPKSGFGSWNSGSSSTSRRIFNKPTYNTKHSVKPTYRNYGSRKNIPTYQAHSNKPSRVNNNNFYKSNYGANSRRNERKPTYHNYYTPNRRIKPTYQDHSKKQPTVIDLSLSNESRLPTSTLALNTQNSSTASTLAPTVIDLSPSNESSILTNISAQNTQNSTTVSTLHPSIPTGIDLSPSNESRLPTSTLAQTTQNSSAVSTLAYKPTNHNYYTPNRRIKPTYQDHSKKLPTVINFTQSNESRLDSLNKELYPSTKFSKIHKLHPTVWAGCSLLVIIIYIIIYKKCKRKKKINSEDPEIPSINPEVQNNLTARIDSYDAPPIDEVIHGTAPLEILLGEPPAYDETRSYVPYDGLCDSEAHRQPLRTNTIEAPPRYSTHDVGSKNQERDWSTAR